MTVNREAVRAFVEALRSGRYQQGRGRLVTGSGANATFCCLGVACIVARDLGLPIGQTDTGFVEDAYTHTIWNSLLPASVRDFYGFSTDDPNLVITRTEAVSARERDLSVPHVPLERQFVETPATEANDAYELNFGQIADAFERTYLSDNNVG